MSGRGVGLCVVAFAAALGACDDLPQIPPPPDKAAIDAAPTFTADERIVATHYFYWYRWPDQHFFDDAKRSDDALRHHLPDHRSVSYESKQWHLRQMRDMVSAGIDVAMCVYWGAPNQYGRDGIDFSLRGIPPLTAALDELAKEGAAPRIGLFYDTTTLLGQYAHADPQEQKVDLRSDEGKDIFYRTIRDFFCLTPPRHWARLDGRPLIQLYSANFSAGHDQSTIDYVYDRFARDFSGVRPFIIAGPSWTFKADAKTGWGAAPNGPIIGDGVVQIGPGYDDSPVPNRSTATRDRLSGAFYCGSWMIALQRRPRLVIIETWNELHEGTGICESLEDGRTYIDLTRRFSDLFKSEQAPPDDAWSAALLRMMRARRSTRSGREHSSRLVVSMRSDPSGQFVDHGIRVLDAADGRHESVKVAGRACLRTRPGEGGAHRYVYFDVADPYYYDHSGSVTIRLSYFDEGGGAIGLHYDSSEGGDSIAHEYKPASTPIQLTDSKTWKTATLSLDAVRFANRQNSGADFRLHVDGSELAVEWIELTKLPADYSSETASTTPP